MSLKYIRVTAAILLFTALTLFFFDYLERLPLRMHGLAHAQIVPALFGGSFGIAILWGTLTLLFGRVYCSVICPLGVLQDVVARFAALFKRKHHYSFRKPWHLLRYGLLTTCIAGFLLNIHLILTLLDPYGIYGRMAASLFRPIVLWGHNAAALIDNAWGYYFGFHYVSNIISWPTAAVSAIMLLLIGYFAWHYGRLYCNTICPVGALLGFLSRYSLFRVRLHKDCISCGLCEQRCKAECIDSKAKTVDGSRCVACFNCLGVCKRGSLLYGINAAKSTPVGIGVPAQSERRSFLGILLASIGASLGAAVPTSLIGKSKTSYTKEHPVTPPGSGNRQRFQKRCTACHLCVAKCPTHVIRPAVADYGLSGFLQPVMSFEHGYCNFNCVICSRVCPNHALLPISMEEKHRLQIGKVVFILENCVVDSQQTSCGACEEHCPTGAVKMVPIDNSEDSLMIPKIDVDLCIGCGACEYGCPVRPYRAIYVDGNPTHLEAKPAFDSSLTQEEIILDDFPF